MYTKLLYFIDYVTTHHLRFLSVLPHNAMKSCFITCITFPLHKYNTFPKVMLAVPSFPCLSFIVSFQETMTYWHYHIQLNLPDTYPVCTLPPCLSANIWSLIKAYWEAEIPEKRHPASAPNTSNISPLRVQLPKEQRLGGRENFWQQLLPRIILLESKLSQLRKNESLEFGLHFFWNSCSLVSKHSMLLKQKHNVKTNNCNLRCL